MAITDLYSTEEMGLVKDFLADLELELGENLDKLITQIDVYIKEKEERN